MCWLLFAERIDGSAHPERPVLMQSGKHLPVACNIAAQIMELSKYMAMLAQLFLSLDSCKEMGGAVFQRTATTIEKCGRKTEAMR